MSENAFPVDLSGLTQSWREAKVQTMDSLPDGLYQVLIESVDLTETKETHKPMFKWCFVVAAGEYQGRHLWKNDVLTTEKMGYFKTDLWKCGLDIEDINDLPGALKQLLDVALEVKQVTKPNPKDPDRPFVNIWI